MISCHRNSLQAIGPDLHLSLAGALAQQVAIDRIVAIREEDRLAAVAALRDAMRQAGDHDAGETGHQPRIAAPPDW
jgi:hypothetical protein